MYVKINKSNQEGIILNALEKAGTYRSLAKKVKIPKSSLDAYKKGRIMPENRFEVLTDYLNIDRRKIN